MDLAVIVGLVGGVCSIVFAYLGYQKGTKKECKDDGRALGVLQSDTGYIKAGVDNLNRKQEVSEQRHFELCERVTAVESSSKQAHLRIDEMKSK